MINNEAVVAEIINFEMLSDKNLKKMQIDTRNLYYRSISGRVFKIVMFLIVYVFLLIELSTRKAITTNIEIMLKVNTPINIISMHIGVGERTIRNEIKRGLVSLTQLQQRNVSYQNALAKKTSAENKLAQTQQEIAAQNIEQNAVIQEYTEKLSKTEGDRFQSMGQVAGSTGDIAKLENQVATYKVRKGLYYILATQDGQITQLTKAGIGEIVKDAETIGIIVPKNIDYIAEIYVKPVDLPLLRENQKVMLTFDGFPAIVFSGWPNSSYGTFSGKIIAIENSISENGLFKAIVAEDKTQKRWPPNMKIGTGASGIAILNDVPIWYEIWRNINGFPPDYYQVNTQKNEKK